ncbi:MAG: RluA family pseudouridine synthase [Candidatus Omnitrophota bacterium]
MKKILFVSTEDEGKRLDKFLAERLSPLSRAKIHSLIKEKTVLVGKEVKKPSFCLRKGDEIRVTLKEKEKNELKPYDFAVKIIYEDQDILVVDKPSGLVVHPPQKHYHKTLINALLYLKKELSSLDPLRPGVVHRLDKETSGVIVLAKNNESHNNLVSQFKERKVKKEYKAIVWGKIQKDKLTVDLPLIRDKKNRLKMKVGFLAPKKAHTDVEVIKRLKDSAYLLIKPTTGRMHQIRVHLKFLGFPIAGDKKYGLKDDCAELLLHAENISFYHPRKGEQLKFNSPLPERFKNFIKEH